MGKTAKQQKKKRDRRAIEEKKRLTVKTQKESRDKRAERRAKLSKERQASGDSSPRTVKLNHMLELNRLWDKQRKDFGEKYGHTRPVGSGSSFVEKAFGSAIADHDDLLASNIVAIALFDEKKFLFACSGIAMERVATTRPDVTVIATSKRLVTEFENNRNKDDRLRIKVLIPGEKKSR